MIERWEDRARTDNHGSSPVRPWTVRKEQELKVFLRLVETASPARDRRRWF